MKLHTDKKLFSESIRAASQYFHIKEVFVEKDYWITLVLCSLSKSKYADQTVFKGGTSLSKGFGLIERFSEDVDIAIIGENNKSSNKIKTIIRTVEKEISGELEEFKIEGVSSKGSRYRKSVFNYLSLDKKNQNNKLILEVNSFANPYPFTQAIIKSMIYDLLIATNNTKYIDEFELQPFSINVLNKEQTLIEKLVSLIRFSYDFNPVVSISKKVRHFYDIYFLMNDIECSSFCSTEEFKEQFKLILEHDQELFDIPEGWSKKNLAASPLLNDFPSIWNELKLQYSTELSALAYAEIPNEKKIAQTFNALIQLIL